VYCCAAIWPGDGPLIWVLRDDRRMAAARAALAFFAPELPVMTFPAWDCLPYDRISPNPAVSAARMATLATLAHRPPGRFVLLTTLNAATQRVPMPALLHSASFAARVGERIDEAGLRRFPGHHGLCPDADRDRNGRLRDPRWDRGHLSRLARASRCGLTCLATYSTGRVDSIPKASAARRGSTGSSWRRSPK
jgi:hypothetical protein